MKLSQFKFKLPAFFHASPNRTQNCGKHLILRMFL